MEPLYSMTPRSACVTNLTVLINSTTLILKGDVCRSNHSSYWMKIWISIILLLLSQLIFLAFIPMHLWQHALCMLAAWGFFHSKAELSCWSIN
jgi:hypothetical protein